MNNNWCFETLGIAATDDIKVIKRAYAKILKHIDQTTQLTEFETLRRAYEAALQWQPSDELNECETSAGSPISSLEHEVPVDLSDTVPIASQTPPLPFDATQVIDVVFNRFIDQVQSSPNETADLLSQVLGSEELMPLDARLVFEVKLIDWLYSQPCPGRAVFMAMVEQFSWRDELPRIESDATQWLQPTLMQYEQWMIEDADWRALSLRAIAFALETPRESYQLNPDVTAENLYHLALSWGRYPQLTALDLAPDVNSDWASLMQQSAELGYVIAQYRLGVMYDLGRGVEQDDAKALIWYQLAAEQGYVHAQYNLGVMYDVGQGVEPDDALALMWYRKAAEQGNKNAQNRLGLMYYSGQGVDVNYAEAMKWYHLAAEQEHMWAQCKLGYMYEHGEGCEEDIAKALALYRLAAQQEHPGAQYNLGVLYENGRGVEQDETQAASWYRLAADQGHDEAQCNLGYLYDNGIGVEQDDAQAVMWYRLSAEQGYALAQCNLGVMYKRGAGVEQDYARAFDWFTLSAEQGFAQAQTCLGFMYINGQFVAQDEGQAAHWYRLAAEQGNADAQCNLGVMYHIGQGVEQDYTQAMKWYRLAAEQGDANAQSNLEMCLKATQALEENKVPESEPENVSESTTKTDKSLMSMAMAWIKRKL